MFLEFVTIRLGEKNVDFNILLKYLIVAMRKAVDPWSWKKLK